MNFKSVITFFLLAASLLFSSIANSAEDTDWHWGQETIRSQGPDTPIDGKLFGIAALKDDIQITFRLEAKSDMSDGGWVGDIRAPEKFYVKFYLIDQNGQRNYFKMKNARAVGNDAQYGSWKEGPSTLPQQAMMFSFSWDEALKIKGHKTLIVNYATADNREETIDIPFSLDTYAANLSEMEAAIRAVPGSRQFLLTEKDVRTTPINHLPANIGTPLIKELSKAAEILGRDKNDLMKLSFDDVETLLSEKRDAGRAAERAAKKAEHKAIYDQEPDWMDLNVCPKPDVSHCRNIGRQGYEKDSMFNKEYDHGKIVGVVWRSEGSIIHIYGGSLDLNIDPEIIRAKTAQYFYIAKDEDGYLELHSVKNMLLR